MARSVHLIGICGSGMSSLALWYRSRGYVVTGCDSDAGENRSELSAKGIQVFEGHDPDHIRDAEEVVFSAAIPHDHPEIVHSLKKGIKVLRRSEALAELANDTTLLAVAGAHGKTTTTAMTGWILQETDLDPTVMLGGRVSQWNGNFRSGSDLTVVEADEYDRAFLHLRPMSAAITSFAIEHLECYGSPEALSVAFGIFLEMTRPGGAVIVPYKNRNLARWAERIGRRVITTGTKGDILCKRIRIDSWEQEYQIGDITGILPLPGEHNLRNAETAIALASTVGVDIADSIRALRSFPGVSRRLERIGEFGSAIVLSDYAHHHDEISAALQGVSQVSNGKICVVFQPHLYSRTAAHAEEMGRALSSADWSLILPVYPAREKPIEGVNNSLIVDAVRRAGGTCDACFHEELKPLLSGMQADVIVFMGAGSVDQYARRIVRGGE
ncbi:MAG: UDP-N-acetylmuramate--L-alanine ligase [Candidatus Aegiribacteria sp.]|nr:UDP-N-acetylmuramate--L-alanine ligase [Candidatus Aegiribacteria sp.]